MTTTHPPDFITSQSDKTVRSILYACWVATFNTPEHHCGLRLAQTQVRCILFACHDGRNAQARHGIDSAVVVIVKELSWWRESESPHRQRWAIDDAQNLASLRDMAVTP